jgi:hypothetical protein
LTRTRFPEIDQSGDGLVRSAASLAQVTVALSNFPTNVPVQPGQVGQDCCGLCGTADGRWGEYRPMADTVYRSKIDEWLFMALAVASLMAVGVCVPLLLYGSWGEWLLAGLSVALGMGLPWWITLTTRYTVTQGFLDIRSGPFHWQVPLRQIKSITSIRSVLSSPALSLDRLKIDYSDARSIMISPEDRERFLADLKSRGVRMN